MTRIFAFILTHKFVILIDLVLLIFLWLFLFLNRSFGAIVSPDLTAADQTVETPIAPLNNRAVLDFKKKLQAEQQSERRDWDTLRDPFTGI